VTVLEIAIGGTRRRRRRRRKRRRNKNISTVAAQKCRIYYPPFLPSSLPLFRQD